MEFLFLGLLAIISLLLPLLLLFIITLVWQSRSLVEEAVLFTLHIARLCVVFGTLRHWIWELIFKQVTHIYWHLLAAILVYVVKNVCQLGGICCFTLVRWRQEQHLFNIRVRFLLHLLNWIVIFNGAIFVAFDLSELLVSTILVRCFFIITFILVEIVRLKYLFLVTRVLRRYIMTLNLRVYPVVVRRVFSYLLTWIIWFLNFVRISNHDTKHSFVVDKHFRW